MKYLKTIFEYNTEYDDHKVNQNVNINNMKPTIDLPLDYFIQPDEDGDDDDEYYSTSAGRDGLYHGTEPGHNKGVKARNTAVYKMSAESNDNDEFGYLNIDYDNIDLTIIPDNYLPRTIYLPVKDNFNNIIPTVNLKSNKKFTEYYKLSSNKMVDTGVERTYQVSILPKEFTHISGIRSFIIEIRL